ncbi:MAG: peptidoglycan-binding protein [Gemmiger sp.]|nr:peptidoglycan-binding protein [Gemmiger sp.]
MAITVQPPYWGVVLRSGSSGPDVALVQRWLNGVRTRWPAIPALTVDGKFGAGTASAVKTFQTVVGLTADGAVGPKTWASLYAAYADQHGAGEIYPGIPQKNGNTGATVKSSQQQLQQLIPALTADGVFGAKTEQAVTAYQTLNALTPDGEIGPKTWAALFGA